jgi:competence protein ComFB
MEELVLARVDEIFEAIGKEKNEPNYCTCDQCRMDIACYALNRIPPHYIVSNRGASRVHKGSIERQQHLADITALVHTGFRKVTHNKRPNFEHTMTAVDPVADKNAPLFYIPTIVGRLFHGDNFAPISDVFVELLHGESLVPMKDANWQNPHHIVASTEGAFSFLPATVRSDVVNESKTFEFTLRVCAAGFETMTHFFSIPVISETPTISAFPLKKTVKVPDLYLFPPSEED